LELKIEELAEAISDLTDEVEKEKHELMTKYCNDFSISEFVFGLVQSFYEDHKEDELIASVFLRKLMSECMIFFYFNHSLT
jgi:hypothetical protein